MAVTLGSSGVPGQVTVNLDSVFATSLANYNKTLIDNIGKTNALLVKLMENQSYKSAEGGTYIAEDLMYALATADWYDGYDELSTQPTDGITQSLWQWRQLAVPIAYSMKERKLNKQRIVDLVQSRIKQAEMGIKEKLNAAILQGSGSGSLATPQTSGLNGASGVDPLPELIAYDPTTSTTVGNINQSTSSWWQNKTKTSAATTYDGLLQEFQNMYNTCALGTGGEPDLVLTDQTTYEIFQAAHWNKFRILENDKRYNFENTKFKNAIVTFDQLVPNVFAGTTDTTTTTGGTAYFINTQFFKLRYESETNFITTDFQKPVNQDARVAHVLWMGNLTCSNRRKQGVIGKISRSITS